MQVLRDFIKDESVDLIYLDPPFKSNANYNMLFRTPANVPPISQIMAFEDTWQWTVESERMFDELMQSDAKTASAVRGLRDGLGANNMMAYIVMMAIRLVELYRVLKPTGSLYLHCDPTASHYLKIILDSIFGPENFMNEIIWKRTGSHNRAKRWGPIHDTIFYYSKTVIKTWNRVLQPYRQEYLDTTYRYSDTNGRYRLTELTGPGIRTGDSGKPWKEVDFTSRGRHWEPPPDRSLPNWFIYPSKWSEMTVQQRLDVLNNQGLVDWGKNGNSLPRFKKYLLPNSGLPLQDVILDILPISGNEDLGYDTQKPVALLERIIKASTNENETVLDPFCGCGTAVHAAQKLNRMWIGIDITHLAIGLVEHRLYNAFFTRPDVCGTPVSTEDAEDLAKRDKFQFETWAATLIPGVLPNKKQVADEGVDGVGFVKIKKDGKIDMHVKIIVSVKSGENLNPSMIRDFAGTMNSKEAHLGIFICLRKPTKSMVTEAAKAGFFSTAFDKYPRIQIHTINEHFDGIRPHLPQRIDIGGGKVDSNIRPDRQASLVP